MLSIMISRVVVVGGGGGLAQTRDVTHETDPKPKLLPTTLRAEHVQSFSISF